MCIKEDPVECHWGCGHVVPNHLGSEIVWCPEALRRGRLCDHIEPADRSKVRHRAEKALCPNCRPRRASMGSVIEHHHDEEEHDDHEKPAPRRRLGSVGPSGVITGV